MAFERAFFALGLAAAAGLAFVSRRQTDGGVSSAAWRGLALAADGISAPFVLGVAGAVFTALKFRWEPRGR